MPSTPFISIVMNGYNSAAYLQEALDSALAQTFTDWELIFWDNQSEDDSERIVRATGDARIHFYCAPRRMSLGEGRNEAIARTTRLPRLPGAASEARGVEARLRAAHPEMALQLLLDTEATPAAFLQHARGAQLLHLACHAVVDDAAQQSALYLAEDATGDDRLDRPDILRAPLNDALVFLSACRSGAGQAAAEGTLGLARDFLRAGARAVVASHWNVPDDVTATLVEHFYTSFVGTNRDVGTALRMAMLATRWELEHTGKKRRPAAHPADWGGFFVLGDGSLRDAPMVTA